LTLSLAQTSVQDLEGEGLTDSGKAKSLTAHFWLDY
jgi:hypothetical protein